MFGRGGGGGRVLFVCILLVNKAKAKHNIFFQNKSLSDLIARYLFKTVSASLRSQVRYLHSDE